MRTAGEQAAGDVASASDRQGQRNGGKVHTAGQQAAGHVASASGGGKNNGGKGSIYEIDEHTKVQCTKATYKIEGDCWTLL